MTNSSTRRVVHPTLTRYYLLLAGIAAAAFAQSLGDYGSLRGLVLDGSQASIPSATVTLQNQLTGVRRTASTDSAARSN